MDIDPEITIRLSEAQRRLIRERIEAGEFASAEEMLLELLGRFQSYDTWRADAKEKIREGIECAERGELIDGEEFFNELEAELIAHAEQAERAKRSV